MAFFKLPFLTPHPSARVDAIRYGLLGGMDFMSVPKSVFKSFDALVETYAVTLRDHLTPDEAYAWGAACLEDFPGGGEALTAALEARDPFAQLWYAVNSL